MMLKTCKKSLKKIWADKLFPSFTEPRTEAKNFCDLLCYTPQSLMVMGSGSLRPEQEGSNRQLPDLTQAARGGGGGKLVQFQSSDGGGSGDTS